MPIAHHGGLFRPGPRGFWVINRAGPRKPGVDRGPIPPGQGRILLSVYFSDALPDCGASQRARHHIGRDDAALRFGPTPAARQPGTACMTRFLIFAAIAPPLGFVVAFWVMLQTANWLAGSPTTFDV